MRTLTVVYDPDCGLCAWLRRHLANEPQYLPIVFVAAGSALAVERFGEFGRRDDELVVIDDTGGAYLGDKAYLMVLWGVRRYRVLALRLATPLLRPLARNAFAALATGRRRLSRLLGLHGERALADDLGQVRVIGCTRANDAPVDATSTRLHAAQAARHPDEVRWLR